MARRLEYGRAWPPPDTALQALIKIGGLFPVRSLLAPDVEMQTNELSTSHLFRHLPAAILHAESTKARKPRVLAAAS